MPLCNLWNNITFNVLLYGLFFLFVGLPFNNESKIWKKSAIKHGIQYSKYPYSELTI